MKQDKKNSSLQRAIEDNLKRAYNDVAEQDVPDRFTQLLAQLRAAETEKSDAKQENVND